MSYSNPILILGMHRSGTSCLTGCLEGLGLYLGNVNVKAGFNAKGNRENRDIMNLHQKILKRVGSTWDVPPDESPEWTQDELSELRNLLSFYNDVDNWGVKDPRILLLLSGWRQVVTPKFVGTFRHPKSVASSLVRRAKAWGQPMTEMKAFNLWNIYNTKMLDVYKNTAFDIVRYDTDIETYNQKVKIIASNIGLEASRLPEFREEELCNEYSEPKDMPDKVKETWEALLASAV